METPFFETIVERANAGVVTAADFAPFIGRENWLSFDRAEPAGADCEPFCSGIVYGFTVINVNRDLNTVHIDIDSIGRVSMNADELAIRIEDS